MIKDKAVGQVNSIKPDYQNNGVSLYLGDCLDKMCAIESGSVDAIIADLPYG